MSAITIWLCRPICFLGKILFKKEGVVWWSYFLIFSFLAFLYFIAVIINLVMLYKILKSEGMDIGFFEYLFTHRSMQLKFFKILFGIQKISNKFYLKILRINFTVAMIILILGFSVVLYSIYLA